MLISILYLLLPLNRPPSHMLRGEVVTLGQGGSLLGSGPLMGEKESSYQYQQPSPVLPFPIRFEYERFRRIDSPLQTDILYRTSIDNCQNMLHTKSSLP